MKKKTNTPAEAQGAGATEKKRFDLADVGFTDLDGNWRPMIFDCKEFGNLLYSNAQTIEMDRVSKAIHLDGKAEVMDDELNQIAGIVVQLSHYNHRSKSAVQEYVNKLISGGK